jgi:hypothetical protein
MIEQFHDPEGTLDHEIGAFEQLGGRFIRANCDPDRKRTVTGKIVECVEGRKVDDVIADEHDRV